MAKREKETASVSDFPNQMCMDAYYDGYELGYWEGEDDNGPSLRQFLFTPSTLTGNAEYDTWFNYGRKDGYNDGYHDAGIY